VLINYLVDFSIYSRVHVSAAFNAGRHVLYLHFESALGVRQHSLILFLSHKADRQSLGAEPPSSAYPMQVLVGAIWHVVIHHDIHALDVDAPPKHIRSHHNSLAERPKLLKMSYTVLLTHRRVDTHGWERVLDEQLVEGVSSPRRLHEDNHLVKLQGV
jgi:hypothetical protein